jgi:hypothetical protein
LFAALQQSGIRPKKGKVLWYTENDPYTPDLVIGNVIVEVDGRIHELSGHKTLDRIRQRALQNMGYHVYRVKNERILNPKERGKVVEEIIQTYYEQEGIMTKKKIQLIEPPEFRTYVPKSLGFFIAENKARMHPDNWSPAHFKQVFEGTSYDPTDYGIMQTVILQLFGHYLTKGVKLLAGMFGKNAEVYFRNVFLIVTANFFKNLVFYGGPQVNHGFVSINDSATLDSHIDDFNRNFARFGITVERKDIAIECEERLKRLDSGTVKNYSWVYNWVKGMASEPKRKK